MSYSFCKNFRTRATAITEMRKETHVPDAVKQLVVDSIESLPPDTDGSFIMVAGNGHQDHTITVRRCAFSPS